LGIEVFAQTRDQLLRELQEQLVVLWQEYAAATDEALSPAALEIKRNLVAAIQEG
jgi:lactate dehydrogenase-like 2-hydroxyacid dehydrogenase